MDQPGLGKRTEWPGMDKWLDVYVPTGLGPGGGKGRIVLPLCVAW